MKNKHLSIIFTAMIIALAFLTVTGCDEGMNMVDPIIKPGPGEEQVKNGEVKKPPEDPEQPDPDEQDPGTPKPTVTIDTVIQTDDGSVSISGTSAELPAGTEVTVVLGDDAITVKATVDETGAWLATVFAEKTAQLTAGTIPVKASSGKATDESSFEHTPPPKPTVTINTVVQIDDGSVIISGASTELPEETEVTVVLGDDAITVKATVDETGAWLATVFAEKTAQLTAGTVAVKASSGKATAESSFAYTAPPEPVEPHENDFVGQVVAPFQSEDALNTYAQAAPGVILTVASGERAGERSVTDEQGNYRFSDPTGATLRLHLQVEGEGYEPKEVIAHRAEPTETLAEGVIFTRTDLDPQKTPGTIFIGHEWPDEVRFILEKTLLPHDLLLVRTDNLPGYAGLYASQTGMVVAKNLNCLLHTIAHELGHAHQHATAVKEMGPSAGVGNWEDTTEARAFAAAREKDWEEVGKASYDGGHFTSLIENMAQTANNYWNTGGIFNTRLCSITVKLKEEAPNRFRWAQEWLNKK